MNNVPFQQMSSNFIKESLLTSHCPPASKLPNDVDRSRDQVGSYSPPRSPSRKDHGSLRKQAESPKPITSPRPYNFDCIGTEIDGEGIRKRRLVGPPTILDVQTEFCGRHLVIPHYFGFVFSHLNESTGSVRLSPRGDSSAISDCKNEVYVNNMNVQGKLAVNDSSRYSHSVHSPSDLTLSTLAVSRGSEEVEVSLLGALFVAFVGGTFFVNIAFGRL